MEKPMILAHRGFSGAYPENTRSAFIAAIEAGCDGFETDVHLTADRQAVVIHDAGLERTSTGSGYVYGHTYKELLEYDFGVKYDPRFKGERIMHLSELMELVREHGLFLNIELKFSEVVYPDFEKTVISIVEQHGMESRTLLSSFNHLSMRLCKQLCPAIRTGLLYANPLFQAEQYARTCGADALHPHYRLLQLEPALTARAKAAGVDINTWTVNDAGDYAQIEELGVSAVITDHPGRFCSAGSGKEAKPWK